MRAETTPGMRAVRDARAPRLSERCARRQRVQLRRQTERPFGVRAGAAVRLAEAGDVDAIARFDILHLAADCFDFTCAVRAWRVRQRGLARVSARANVRVNGIDTRRTDMHDHVTWARLRIRELFQLHHLGPAELAHANRFHVRSLPARLKPSRYQRPITSARCSAKALAERPDAIMRNSMLSVKLHKTVGVKVGHVQVGGGAPIVVQSMTMTDTADARATAQQCIELAEAGSELVRVTVNLPEAAAAVPEIKQRMLDAGCLAPLIGDFHYNGHLLLTKYPECARALDKYRINPGNVGNRQAPRRTVLHDLQGGGRQREAGPHRRERRLAQSGAGRREDAGEHRRRSRPLLGRHHQRVHGAVGDRVDGARDRERPAPRPDHHLVQDVAAAGPHRRLSRAGPRHRSAAAPRSHRSRHGHQRTRVVVGGDGRPAERRQSATRFASR